MQIIRLVCSCIGVDADSTYYQKYTMAQNIFNLFNNLTYTLFFKNKVPFTVRYLRSSGVKLA